jgi:glycosyltransferase involved in cell wall biosynthesis
MHIAILSDWEASGGANIAAFRLTEGFAAAGHHITRIYQKASLTDPRWDTRLIASSWSSHEFSLAGKAAWRMTPDSVKVSIAQRKSERTLASILEEVRPDVVSVHNLHMARWSPDIIGACARYAPTVCTLHDTWTLTGRCYYPIIAGSSDDGAGIRSDCQKYLSGCDHLCPTPHEYPALKPQEIRAAWDLRLKLFGECENLAAVTPCTWLGRMAASQMWKRRPVFRIPYGIDLECYKPVNRETAQRILGLRPEFPVVLCCAAELSNRKKGLQFALEALGTGFGRIQLLLMGAPAAIPPLPGVQVHQLGYIQNERMKALVYNSADLSIHPSLADNAPNTVIEALSCGTPVVAFPVDGMPELVFPGKTGWLASEVSIASLRAAIAEAFADLEMGVDLRTSSRQFAEEQYYMPDVIQSYERVFEYMRSGRNSEISDLLIACPNGQSVEPEVAAAASL